MEVNGLTTNPGAIELVKCQYYDAEYLKKYSIFTTTNIYFIEINNERCGVIEFRETCEFSLKIDYLLIFPEYQGKGVGTKTIEYLKIMFPYHEIYGEAIPLESTILFWKSLNSEFEMEKN